MECQIADIGTQLIFVITLILDCIDFINECLIMYNKSVASRAYPSPGIDFVQQIIQRHEN